jgi:hypothetical protein
VSERRSLDRVEEFSTLGGFVGDVVTWMGRGDVGREGEAGKDGFDRRHCEEF